MKLTELRGTGPKTEALFAKLGIRTQEELLNYFPLVYDYYDSPRPIRDAGEGGPVSVAGYVRSRPVIKKGGRTDLLILTVSDGADTMRVIWFHANYLAGRLETGHRYVFRGNVHRDRGVLTMNHPAFYSPAEYERLCGTMLPVYSLTKGLTGNAVRKTVRAVFDQSPDLLREYLPELLRKPREGASPEERGMIGEISSLMGEAEAIRQIHFPESAGKYGDARRRLAFDEFFLFMLALARRRAEEESAPSAFSMRAAAATEKLIAELPFSLTAAQERAWREIEADLTGGGVMTRLLRGDVGSGKTIVAFLAMLLAAENGYQSVLMAPTEILARQHYGKLVKLREEYGLDALRPCLLTGSMTMKEKRAAVRAVESGEANAVIGTHALIQEGVSFARLALAVTDEQHRFGVRQRRLLSEKGNLPHTLVMSATPIPRTLAVVMTSGIAVSSIDELPASRLPVKNAVVDTSWRENTLRFLGKQMKEGRQVYVLCPMIEPSPELSCANVTEEARAMKSVFPDKKTGILHGRMKPEEKNRVMEEFLAGSLDLLVTTTVVEVGVDVPNATVMLVENAERFGLAALHQLRGRVGRGSRQSYCIFMAGDSSPRVMERLGILKESNDGAFIAEKDFELRGPGDILGVRQSGESVFGIADPAADSSLGVLAGQAVKKLLSEDPGLSLPDSRLCVEELEKRGYADEGSLGI